MDIKQSAKEVSSVLKEVFSDWRYVSLSASVLAVFYLANALITNYGNLSSVYSSLGFIEMIKISPVYFFGFGNLLTSGSLATLLIIGALFGMLVSLLLYKTRMIRSASGTIGVFASAGIFLGVLAPGCAACGIGLLAVLGIGSAFIGSLPYQGLELSFLSIAILSFSVVKISKDIKKGIVCEVK